MDEFKNLILKYNKNYDEWEDITKSLSSVQKGRPLCQICFNNGKKYNINSCNLKVFTRGINLSIDNSVFVMRGTYLTNIVKVLFFDGWYKIFFSNASTAICYKDEMKVMHNLMHTDDKVANVVNYLMDIACVEKGNTQDDLQNDYLYKQWKKKSILDNSVLGKLFTNNLKNYANNKSLLFPFDTNLSQSKAVYNALNNDISLIQGPPGTGKTETILNIVANCIYNGKSVAVVSGNNEATKNVNEKLSKRGYNHLGALLGNDENVKAFFAQTTKKITKYEVKGDENYKKFELARKLELYQTIMEQSVEIGKTKQLLQEFIAEQRASLAEHDFDNELVNIKLKKKKFSSKKYLKLLGGLEMLNDRNVSPWTRLKILLCYNLNVKVLLDNLQANINYIRSKYYEQKIAELDKDITSKTKFLKANNAKKVADDIKILSNEIFQMHLNRRFADSKDVFSENNYKYQFEKFVKHYPIIYSTTHALAQCTKTNYLYDYLIIDESSQVDLISGLLALACAKRVVLVGDLMQLPHVVPNYMRSVYQQIFDKYHLPDFFNYNENSLLEFMTKIYSNVPQILLNEHYRCDPEIIGFCNKRFYGGKLIVRSQHKKDGGILIIRNTAHSCRGRTNERQGESILKEVLPEVETSSFGVIAPYRAQVDLLSKLIGNKASAVDTVHKFQGRECKYIALSTVSNEVAFYEDETKIDFLNNKNLINVAISRAQQRLFVLASEKILQQENTLLKDLADYCQYFCQDSYIVDTQVYSVFDLMYEDYNPILNKLKKKLVNISQYTSENIIATVIEEICQQDEFNSIGYLFQYPLNGIINTQDLSDSEDKKFVSNVLTHCDFVLYSKLNKKIKLVVEVDGAHHNEEIQKQRDARKDRLLSSVGINVLRLPTTTVNCKEKIINILRGVSNN